MIQQYYEKDKIEVGVDEVGRGCLFGPIVIGSVVWMNEDPYPDYTIKDSKKCSVEQRSLLSDYIQSFAIAQETQFISEKDVDSMNVLQATMKGMHQSLDKITQQLDIDTILVDGNYFPFYTHKDTFDVISHICVTNGDNRYKSIAAASILAKQTRDTYILQLVEEYPELKKYDIQNNKGYGTKKHIDAIKEYGITPWHRRTFGICKEYC